MTFHIAFQQLNKQLLELYDSREAANIANWVMEKVTNLSKTNRIVLKDELLTQVQLDQLTIISNELMLNKPIQYVLNEAWFTGMCFYVNESVLIPRPETDELIEWLLNEVDHNKSTTILDVGTGSGCIPIALKKRLHNSSITSVDISQNALEVANKNAKTHQVDIQFKQLDFLDESNWENVGKYEFIISNPPYIKDNESVEMSKRVLNFEPNIALFVPDEQPLIFYDKIAKFGLKHLANGGAIYVEINQALGRETVELFHHYGYKTTLKKDLQQNDRMIKAVR